MNSRYLDLLERTAWTGVQGGLAVWIATDVDLFSAEALKVAGVAAVIAAVKCLLAFQVGAGNTAATLPAGPDTDLGGEQGAISVAEVVLLTLLVLVILLILGVI